MTRIASSPLSSRVALLLVLVVLLGAWTSLGAADASRVAEPRSPEPRDAPKPPVAAPLPHAAESFDRCWELVQERFYDSELHGVDWSAARERHRSRAVAATTGREFRDALRGLLAELRASHLTVVAPEVFEMMAYELRDRRLETFGILIEESKPGFFFVRDLYEGGPGEKAGMQVGDRLVLLEGLAPDSSPWMINAGYDPGLPGPTLYFLRPLGGPLKVVTQRTRDERSRRTVELRTHRMNAADAARNSVRVFDTDRGRIGYIHLWYCSRGIDMLLSSTLSGKLAGCDGLVVDLRGRGGRPEMVAAILRLFREKEGNGEDDRDRTTPTWSAPTAFLIDGRSRSAKEALAFIAKEDSLATVVGERSEGAVLGARFFPLPDGSYLEIPVIDFPVRGVRLEGRGVAPDVRVDMPIPFLEGVDPILDRGVEVIVDQLRTSSR